MKKVLIVDEIHPLLIDELLMLGFSVDYVPDIPTAEVVKVMTDYFGIVVRSKVTIDEAFLSGCNRLKFIARAGAGLDQLDEDAIISKGIAILNAPEGNKNALAEHMIGMLLSLFHKLHIANQQVRSGVWDREGNRGIELQGKTVGIIGYGHMGSSFASKLASFGCTILAYDLNKVGFGSSLVKEVKMNEIFEKADILSLHVPLTEQTTALVNEDFISKFKKPFYFLNSARGKVMETSAVVEALQAGKIMGACLDVLENEKFSTYSKQDKELFDKLTSFPQVLLSPHVAGWTVESYEGISRVLADKIKKFMFSEVDKNLA